jgi:hypothetical protein
MKMLTTALLVAWLGAGVVATYLWRQLDTLREENSVLLARVTAAETRQGVSSAPLSQVAGAAPLLPPTSPALSPAKAHDPSNTGTEDFRRSMMRATMSEQYPDLDKVLGLTPDQLGTFEELLIRQYTSPTFGRSAADRAGLGTFLGDKLPRWQTYQESLPGRQQVNLLRGQLAASGRTLSDEQAQSLVAALNLEMKRAELKRRSTLLPASSALQDASEKELQRAADTNTRQVTAAKAILDAQQLDIFRSMLDKRLNMMRMTTDVMSSIQSQTITPR